MTAMRPLLVRGLALTCLACLGACASAPKGAVEPLAFPALPAAPAAAPTNGAIYQADNSLALFEDRRARRVGDVITINIVEKAAANKQASTSVGRGSSVDDKISALFGLPLTTPVLPLAGRSLNADLSASSSNKFEGKGSSAQSNSFIGTITATVVQVQANGNLVVSGEKRVRINQGEEYIRLAGVVRPESIAADNSVLSTQVANARIEYRGSGSIDEAQRMGWLQRFFMNVWPF